ncbi:hypothetical protein HT746_35520 [Burkholderia pyrrocinia]|uniref:hypothetical protein n=1 Tax=Burkholderia pyrrocinia TaxID=60550 RepID=UPI0015772ECB|nr:hypothetical protein [Burkholderia pyrrocinia]NTX32356.1 hypothetical protein [Burkholderia pyrrocinia]
MLALLFGMSFLSHHQIAVNEAGDVEPVHLDAIGYWCRLASFDAASVGAALLPGRANVRRFRRVGVEVDGGESGRRRNGSAHRHAACSDA